MTSLAETNGPEMYDCPMADECGRFDTPVALLEHVGAHDTDEVRRALLRYSWRYWTLVALVEAFADDFDDECPAAWAQTPMPEHREEHTP